MNREKFKNRRRDLLDFVRRVAVDSNLTHREIGHRMGWKANNVSRMLAGKYGASLDSFLMLIEAVGLTWDDLPDYE